MPFARNPRHSGSWLHLPSSLPALRDHGCDRPRDGIDLALIEACDVDAPVVEAVDRKAIAKLTHLRAVEWQKSKYPMTVSDVLQAGNAGVVLDNVCEVAPTIAQIPVHRLQFA